MRLLTFGGLSLVNSSGSDVAQQRRRLGLLVLLASAPARTVSRDRLMALLSPESSTQSARHALQQLVYYLRQQAGNSIFLGTDPLRLNPDVVTSDVGDFEDALKRGALDEAVALYRGPFLDGFHLDSAEFEDWAEGERTRLAARHSDALFRLAQSAQTAGDHVRAIERWRQLAALDPLSARITLGLMGALSAAGDTAGALRQARVHEALERSQLGRGPDPEVARFAVQLQTTAPDTLPLQRRAILTSGNPEIAPELNGPQREQAVRPRHAHRAPWSRRAAFSAVAVLVIMGGGLGLQRTVRGATDRVRPFPRSAVAVLPFQNLSAESSHAYFARGLHDELLTQLSKVGGLKVTSGQSVLKYAETGTPLRTIASDLQVGSVVQASVQVIGSRLRVTVQLIDATTDVHLWAERYDRALDDAFAIQSDLARQIVRAVDVHLSAAEAQSLGTAYTSNVEAYRLYLQGRDYFMRPTKYSEDMDIAQRFFERAIVLDPDFALAHVALAEVHGLNYITRYDRTAARAEQQRMHAETALRLAPDLPQAHLALGSWHYQVRRDYARALAELRIAVEGLPNDVEVWARIGQTTRRMGRWKESLEAHERTAELSPRDAGVFKELGATLMWMHRYREANAAYDRALLLAPELRYPHLLKARSYVLDNGQLDTLRAVLAARPWDPRMSALTSAHRDLAYWDRKPAEMIRMAGTAPDGSFIEQNSFVPAALYAAWAHQLRGDKIAAVRAFDSARVFMDSALKEHPDDDRMHAALGLALAGLGDRHGARREASWLRQSMAYRMDKFQGRFAVTNRARILAQIGDLDAALDELEVLLSTPSLITVHVLRLDPSWDPLRSHPRFRRLIARSWTPDA